MRLSALLIVLPSLALAADQQPLGDIGDKVKGWFKQAQSYIDKSVPTAAAKATSAIPSNPVKTATDKLKDAAVSHLTLGNWKETFKPSGKTKSGQPEEWMVFLTGGNKTCWGLCGKADEAWKGAVPLLKARSNGPRLAEVDCDEEQILCNCWAAGPPSIYTFLVPQPLPDQSRPHTPVYNTRLNRTSVTTTELVNLHTKQDYRQVGEYNGYWHPFDGPLVKFGLEVPVAYAMWLLSKMPSWLPMVGVSLGTRWFTSRRMANQQARQPGSAGQAAPGAAPAPAR